MGGVGDGAGPRRAGDLRDGGGVGRDVVVGFEGAVVFDGSRLVGDGFGGVLIGEDGSIGGADEEVGVEVGGEVFVRGGGDEFDGGESVERFDERSAERSRGESVEGGREFVDEDGGW